MQVGPIEPTLKAPGTKRLKLGYDEPLPTFAFKFNLRCYNEDPAMKVVCDEVRWCRLTPG